ncbi:MAG: glycosyltransferase family 2 protein [Deltaproteobacteria bacterium]|jgi:glycosyltransferase involved in cell wall biosynthesis|nr:glycosyltransferase family 2 protein [Deltaproteobacteria bacterium]
MAEPKLTICVPVYNGEKTIATLLKSLTSQTMEDIRILVSDNNSEDNTGKICKNMASRDSRIVYSKNPENLGLIFNFAHLFMAHSSPFTAYAAADLVWKPSMAEKCVQTLEENPDALVAYPYCQFLDDDKKTDEIYFDKITFDDPDPSTRFLNVIKYLGWTTPFLGVMRTFNAAKSYMFTMYLYNEDLAGDNLLLANLALQGRILQVPEILLQRTKDSSQKEKLPHGLLDRYLKIDKMNASPSGQGIRLPTINYIHNHCKLIAHSDLSLEEKDKLVKPAISALLSRYQGQIHFELQRALKLISLAKFRQGWEDDLKEINKEEIDRTRYHHLDFVYVARLIQEMEFVEALMPGYPFIHFAKAVLYNALGRNKETQLALIQQLEHTPAHQPSKDFLSMLTKKVA